MVTWQVAVLPLTVVTVIVPVLLEVVVVNRPFPSMVNELLALALHVSSLLRAFSGYTVAMNWKDSVLMSVRSVTFSTTLSGSISTSVVGWTDEK